MNGGPQQPLPTPASGAGGQLQNAPQAAPGPTPQPGGQANPSPQPDPTMATIPGTPGQQAPDDDEKMASFIDYAYTQTNLAKHLKKKKPEVLLEMGQEIVKGYDEDEISREGWMERNEEWMKLALLVREDKSYPWPKASNVKYPLLATAAMQFSARAYPALVPSDGHIVKTKIVQLNPQDPVYEAATRISNHMSYQLLERIPDWEENMDKLLMTMSISGICFKETYHSPVDGVHHSSLVYPEDFCVNYHAKSLAKAYRKTRILKYSDNEIQEKVNNDEEFLDVDLSKPTEQESNRELPATGVTPPPVDKSTPHKFIACHTFWDLDGDGYEEPYVIVVHYDTKQVVRVMARWCTDGVHQTEPDDGKKPKIIKIEPLEYFTAFPFIPNPDGSIYALGFGLLLGPLNESVNSIINQLIDSGTLNNLQSGFIGKGLRLRMGQTSLQPGEFKVVNATGEDLHKSFFMMPTKEPSNVLFQLLNMLITSGNQLASIAEIFVGKMPGQNTPASTTQDTIQQGMAVFTAIYKRVYRSLDQEFKKLFWLNKISPGIVEEESNLSGIQLTASDYALPAWSILPGADPSGDTGMQRQHKMQSVGQLLSLGTIDPMVYTRRVLDANDVPNAQQLLRQPSPPPEDPKMATEKMKQQTMAQGAQQDAQAHQMKMQADAQEVQNKQKVAEIEAAKQENKLRHEEQMQALKQQGAETATRMTALEQTIKNHFKLQQGNLTLAEDRAKAEQGTAHAHVDHVQGVVHAQEKHTQDLKNSKEVTKAKAAAKPKTPKK